MTIADGVKLAGAAVVLATSLGVGCQDGERSAPQAYCEADTLTGQPLECCRLCPVSGGLEDRDCELPVPPSQFRGISAVWEEWRGLCPAARVSAGSCSNGMSFILWSDGLSAERRYFDESGAFVALETFVDVIVEPCDGHWYWPRVVECEPVAGQILCQPPAETLQASDAAR